MALPDDRDLGRLVYAGIQSEDAVFARASDEIGDIIRALPDGRLTDIDRRRAMQSIDRVLNRAFGATQDAALRSDLFRSILESVNRAADLPFARNMDRIAGVLRNEPVYRGLYGRVVTEQRAARAAMHDANRRWVDPKGYRLSDRVWKQGKIVRREIDDILRDGIRRGRDAVEIARDLERYLDPAKAPTQYLRNGKIVRRNTTALPLRPGVKGDAAYGSSYARTLARTEITRAHGMAVIESAKITPGVRGVQWRLSGSHPEPDACDDNASRDRYGLGAGVYPPENVPRYPNHPNDICTLLPAVMSRSDMLDELVKEYGHE